ncbi:hypothetical protein J3R30DRAFT_3403593 [Lentinula aciculospora]|uniref:Uncharacterized protein n=1 Tax=Lentinula aciculospora TaxID=153920 RepID=A0A9W9AD38_9AGAR|nr:hypothetical protein J3R30DRAFT_3403593 [Lentinula aciculospora]
MRRIINSDSREFKPQTNLARTQHRRRGKGQGTALIQWTLKDEDKGKMAEVKANEVKKTTKAKTKTPKRGREHDLFKSPVLQTRYQHGKIEKPYSIRSAGQRMSFPWNSQRNMQEKAPIETRSVEAESSTHGHIPLWGTRDSHSIPEFVNAKERDDEQEEERSPVECVREKNATGFPFTSDPTHEARMRLTEMMEVQFEVERRAEQEKLKTLIAWLNQEKIQRQESRVFLSRRRQV